jgi:MFS transporter, DHA2 family, multidrug resistance protein
VVLCIAVFISTVDTTIVNVALPDIAQDLSATTAELQWVMDAYTIALAGLILLGGGLADRFGRKRIFITGLALFAATSLLATFADSAVELITYRALMGTGAALIMPPALSLIAVIFPPEQRRVALSVWSAIAGLGVAMGPVAGGILLDNFWWGSAFLVNVPVALITIVGAFVLLPESRRPGVPPLDILGAVLSVLALGGLIYGIIEGPHTGWLEPDILIGIGLGIAMFFAFTWWELRTQDPLFDVRVLGNPQVLAGFTTIFLFYVAFLGIEFVIPQYLQSVEDRSTLAAGLVLLPFGVVVLLASPFVPRVITRFGYRRLLSGTMVGLGVGAATLSLLGVLGGPLIVMLGLAIAGTALGLGFPPSTAVVLNSLPVEKAGDGSAVNQVARQVGAAFGVALIGSILAGVYTSEISSSTESLSESEAETAEHSITGAQSVAAELGSREAARLTSAADDAFKRGTEVALWTLVGLTLAGALFTFRLMRGAPIDAAPPPTNAPPAESAAG